MKTRSTSVSQVTTKTIFNTWWPLSASWLMMGLGLPMLSAIIARLPDPEINLAAYGGIVQPVTLFIASPIIMLLSASTALSKDRVTYRKLRRFMLTASGVLTAVHILIAFTPLYYLLVRNIIGAPEEIIEPARIGLMITVPWTLAIAYRRFQQGVMIRFGHANAVGIGTVTRLVPTLTMLLIGYSMKTIPGVILASCAQITGLLCEALYSAIRVRPILRREMQNQTAGEQLTLHSFSSFYIPLAMTTMLGLLWQPIGTAAISRMPNPLTALAIWPVVNGSLFILRSPGTAYNEVVVALMDKPGSWKNLRRFTISMVSGTTMLFIVFVTTPLAQMWYKDFAALSPSLIGLALNAYWLTFAFPALNVLLSWFQGTILTSKKTRGIPESVIVSLLAFLSVLLIGVFWNKVFGLYVGVVAMLIGTLGQTLWLWYRSRLPSRAFIKRDQELELTPQS